MRNSDHPIRKALIVSVCFVLCFVLVIAMITVPWMSVYQDRDLRDSLAGTIDTLYTGSSYGVYGIMPSVIDAKTGGRSYNICGLSLPVYGMTELLKKELERNPVKRVFLTVSFQTLTRNQDEDGIEGDVYLLPRLSSLREQAAYACKHIPLSSVFVALSQDIFLAIRYYRYKFFGGLEMERIYEDNGYSPFIHEDMSLTKEEAARTKDASKINTTPRADNLSQLEEVVRICREAGTEVVMITTPLTDREIWQHSGWDEFHEYYAEFARDHGASFLDFNLLRDRYRLFDDASSYGDQYHLCETGARAFSDVLADVIADADAGEDVSGRFYSTYAEMKQDSPYAAMTE